LTKLTNFANINYMELLKSASKIVFIALALTACIGLFMGVVSQENFMILTGSAFAFFFAQKGDPTKPFAGK